MHPAQCQISHSFALRLSVHAGDLRAVCVCAACVRAASVACGLVSHVRHVQRHAHMRVRDRVCPSPLSAPTRSRIAIR